MILQKLLNSLQGSLILESEYFFIDILTCIPLPELMMLHNLIWQKVKVFIPQLSFFYSVFFMLESLDVDLSIANVLQRRLAPKLLDSRIGVILADDWIFKHVDHEVFDSLFVVLCQLDVLLCLLI